MLFSEPKIPQSCLFGGSRRSGGVSVLFSEPKIPQFHSVHLQHIQIRSFSALQRAENSSIVNRRTRHLRNHNVSVLFSEPKIPQSDAGAVQTIDAVSFSALQRAENSSIKRRRRTSTVLNAFQCSSASRKFLNYEWMASGATHFKGVSVLFSEPKIPQSSDAQSVRR